MLACFDRCMPRGVCVTLSLALLVPMAACTLWEESQRAASMACMASVHSALLSIDGATLGLMQVPNDEWQNLDAAETKRLLLLAARQRALDCRGEPGQPLLDPWRHPVQLAVKLSTSNKLAFKVYSSGSDGVDGTSDDLVSVLPDR